MLILGVGILCVHPDLQLPAFTRCADGTGPIVAGKSFPLCFITIACGAISGFQALISSGDDPEDECPRGPRRPGGYGAMLLESFVAIMAMINGLRMVAQIVPRWNPLTGWMRQIEDFSRAA